MASRESWGCGARAIWGNVPTVPNSSSAPAALLARLCVSSHGPGTVKRSDNHELQYACLSRDVDRLSRHYHIHIHFCLLSFGELVTSKAKGVTFAGIHRIVCWFVVPSPTTSSLFWTSTPARGSRSGVALFHGSPPRELGKGGMGGMISRSGRAAPPRHELLRDKTSERLND